MESMPTITAMGNKYWFNEKGECHRLDGPAVERLDNIKEWRIENKFHRLNGPARIWRLTNSIDSNWFINLSVSYVPIMDNA